MTDDVGDDVPRLMQDIQAITAWEEYQASKPDLMAGDKKDEVFFVLSELYERLENKLTLAVDNTIPRALRTSRDLFDAILERNGSDEDRDEDPPDLTPAS